MALVILLLVYCFLALMLPIVPAASGDLSDSLPNVVVGNQWAVNTTFWVSWTTDVGPIQFIVYTCTSNFSTVYAGGMSGCQNLHYVYVESAMSGGAWFSVPPSGAAMLEWRDPPGCNPCAAGPAISFSAFASSIFVGVFGSVFFGVLIAVLMHMRTKQIRGLLEGEKVMARSRPTCSGCGRPWSEGDLFCPKCGKSVK